MAKTKLHEWILVGLAGIAVFDALYVRHRSLQLAEAIAKKQELASGAGLQPELEGDPGSLAACFLAGIPRN